MKCGARRSHAQRLGDVAFRSGSGRSDDDRVNPAVIKLGAPSHYMVLPQWQVLTLTDYVKKVFCGSRVR